MGADSRRALVRNGVAAAMLLFCAVRAMAGLPPIVEPPTGEYRHGKFVWIDLVTTDVREARRFYGGLFGWTFAETGSGSQSYTLAYQAGFPVGGMAERQPSPDQKRHARWIAFVSVPDVKAAATAVVARGGVELIAPRRVEGRGDMAIMADPDGAPFGFIDSASGDPPDYLAEVGDWIWALYQSPDASSAAAFYQDIGDYEVVPDERFPDRRHFFLVAGGYTRASLAQIPPERTGLRPEWLYFVRVADVDASAARAAELGGRIIVAPDPAVFAGRIAVIADPAGAPVGLMEWEDEGGEVN
ncbi:MAG: VOC family protein [Gammaproteobacteria bacterium]|nr:VOC family protein [Gammaproteobacteria bacterium]